jgi:hypothetical protein
VNAVKPAPEDVAPLRQLAEVVAKANLYLYKYAYFSEVFDRRK